MLTRIPVHNWLRKLLPRQPGKQSEKCRRKKSGKKAGTKTRTILKKETKEKRVGDQEITGKTDCNRGEIREAGTEILGRTV